jgi:hypothetical protein
MSTAADIPYDEAALLERLTTGVQRSNQPVIFLVGSGLTAPISDGGAGVPGVRGVIELIKAEFDATQQSELEKQIRDSANPYQSAFSFLLGRRGQQAANQIIRQAVCRLGIRWLSTLSSIWQTLHERQKIVLQTMAETVRPETVQTVGDYCSKKIEAPMSKIKASSEVGWASFCWQRVTSVLRRRSCRRPDRNGDWLLRNGSCR